MSFKLFANEQNPTGPQLDGDLSQLAQMGWTGCTVSGSPNTVILTTDPNKPVPSLLQNYQAYFFIPISTNTANVTIQVNSFSPLPVYKDNAAGPNVLGGGEIVQNCAYVAVFDQTLNAGGGGFHIFACGVITNTSLLPNQIQLLFNGVPGSALTRLLSATYTVGYTVIPANSTQDQVVILTSAALNDIVGHGLQASVPAGLLFQGRVPAAGSITLRAANITAASIAAFTATVHISAMGMAP